MTNTPATKSLSPTEASRLLALPFVDAPAQIGRYRVLGRLGSGGMGVVYAAYDPELGRKVAIKLIHDERDAAPQRRQELLLREAKAQAIGSGGIKPCVSAHLGDQFGARNTHRLERMYTWFYFAVNVGSALSMLATPWLLGHYRPHVGFGVPGLLMLVATMMFRAGRDVFVHVPPGGMATLRQTFSRAGLASISTLLTLYAFMSVFFALFSQTGSAWVVQAQQMDRMIFGVELLPAQVQAAEPIFLLALLPLSTYVVYPTLARWFEPTPERRIGLGMGLMALVFVLLAWIEMRIVAGEAPSIGWHILGYLVLTLAEVLVTVTCIELSYTRAPRHMKSLIMAMLAFSVAHWLTIGGTHARS